MDGQHQLLVVALPLPGLAGADAVLPAAGGRLWRGVLLLVRLQPVLLSDQMLYLSFDQRVALVLLLARSAVFGVADGERPVADLEYRGAAGTRQYPAGAVPADADLAALSCACRHACGRARANHRAAGGVAIDRGALR